MRDFLIKQSKGKRKGKNRTKRVGKCNLIHMQIWSVEKLGFSCRKRHSYKEISMAYNNSSPSQGTILIYMIYMMIFIWLHNMNTQIQSVDCKGREILLLIIKPQLWHKILKQPPLFINTKVKGVKSLRLKVKSKVRNITFYSAKITSPFAQPLWIH